MSIKDKIEIRNRSFLNKTFEEFRNDMVNYIRTYYPDKLQDFSVNGILGSLVDIGAAVNDNMSFYLDHQFSELDPDTAIEDQNIEMHLKNAGVKILGSSPSVGELTIEIEIPADNSDLTKPNDLALPIIKNDCIFTSLEGINFRLIDDVDFSEKDSLGVYKATILPTENNTFIFKKKAFIISGDIITENFNITNFTAFRKITLQNKNVTDIISVRDSFNIQYYEVNDLSEDTVYQTITSINNNSEIVKDSIKLISAPYRFTSEVLITDRKITLTFGGGSGSGFELDAIPDPSEYAINFYGKKINKNFSLNPSKLLNTKTLGVASENCTLFVTYRYGGGLNHNVPSLSITNISIKNIEFNDLLTDQTIKRDVSRSMLVYNELETSGGTDAPTISELKAFIKSEKNSQLRIVTKQDLLGRLYTIPSNFGRVFRASLKDNPNNPLSTQLFVISKNLDNNLIICSDLLKNNLKTYLNNQRLISDSIDILDAQVINLRLKFQIIKDPAYNKNDILNNILNKLKNYLNINNFYIDQPIILSEIVTLIMSTEGVVAMEPFNDKSMLKFECLTGIVNEIIYSNSSIDVNSSIKKGLLIPPPGSIFEFKYPDIDIIGKIS